MAVHEYRIKEFFGLDQSTEEGAVEPGNSPDACNMDTADGSLSVAKGYVKHIDTPVPGEAPISRLFVWQHLATTRYIVVAGHAIYAWSDAQAQPAWTQIFAYPDEISAPYVHMALAQINSVEHILFACNAHPIVKWDGENAAALFGSASGQSDKHVAVLAMHYGRLFAAGDPACPGRLFWSQTPGDARSIANWGADAASQNTSGGHLEVGDTAGDPIIGLAALSSQLLIFKRRSIYRLLGDRPSNYRVYRVHAEMEQMQNAACVTYGDVPYWMAGGGLYYFDGQSALRSRNAKRISRFLSGADHANCRAAKNKDRLYFTAYERAPGAAGAGARAGRTMRSWCMIRSARRIC